MNDKIIEIIAKSLEVQVSDIELETAVGDIPEWDSLHHIAIIENLQRAFGITFEEADLMELEDVADLVSLVKSMTA